MFSTWPTTRTLTPRCFAAINPSTTFGALRLYIAMSIEYFAAASSARVMAEKSSPPRATLPGGNASDVSTLLLK